MAASNQGPIGDRDAVTATALGFAGMAMLQSKLFPAIAQINLPWMRKLLESHWFEWWPLLLIASGIALWLVQSMERRLQKRNAWKSRLGGAHESRS